MTIKDLKNGVTCGGKGKIGLMKTGFYNLLTIDLQLDKAREGLDDALFLIGVMEKDKKDINKWADGMKEEAEAREVF